ncbi:MAG TPA: cupredoxin domain-containing protein [Gaiellaceae bacterium]|jgi:uncharacterized cupredoxin-like copper-binding protein|nr:cupredoxin domain-containing protein [Gaiellaceae bacterium]
MRVVNRIPVVVFTCVVFAFLAASAVRAAQSRPSAAVSTVKATLTEMRIAISTTRVPAGKVTFVVRNAGTTEHELLVIPWPKAGKLALARFKANETTSLGEVSELKPGKTGRVTLELPPGRYLLICNLSGHYQLGMQAALVAAAS